MSKMKFSNLSFLALFSIFAGAFSTTCASIQQRGVFIPKFETRTAEDAPPILQKILMTSLPKWRA